MQPFTNVVFWDVFHINGLACEQLMAPDSDQSCLVAVRENYLPVIIEHVPWAAVHETFAPPFLTQTLAIRERLV